MWSSCSQVTFSCCLGMGGIWDTVQPSQSRLFFHYRQQKRNPHHVSSRRHQLVDIWSFIRSEAGISLEYQKTLMLVWPRCAIISDYLSFFSKTFKSAWRNRLLGHVSWVQGFFFLLFPCCHLFGDPLTQLLSGWLAERKIWLWNIFVLCLLSGPQGSFTLCIFLQCSASIISLH